MSRFTECAEAGCEKTIEDGPIFRTSPKGEPFEGKCAEHAGDTASQGQKDSPNA